MLNKYISGHEVISNLDIRPFQLIELIERGLLPHYPDTGEVMIDIQVQIRDAQQKAWQFSCAKSELKVTNIKSVDWEGWEWVPTGAFSRTEDNYQFFSNALYSCAVLDRMVGELPASCPNHKACLKEYETNISKDNNDKNTDKKLSKTDLLDQSSEFYSSELAIALLCWEELFLNGRYKSKRSVKDQIGEWLKANSPGLSKSSRARITTIVNPDKLKAGGSPRLSE